MGIKELDLVLGIMEKSCNKERVVWEMEKRKLKKCRKETLWFSFKWEDIASCVGSFEGEGKDTNSKRKKEVKDNHGCRSLDGA